MNEFERKAQSVTQRALPDRGSVLMFTKALSSVTGQSSMKGKPLTNSVTTRPSSSSAAHSNHTTPTNTSNTTGASTKRVAKMNTKVSKPQLDFQDQLPITAHFPKTLSEKTPIIRNSGPIDLTDDVDESHAKESVLDDIGGILHTKPTINSIEDDDDAFQQPKQRKVHPAKGKSGLPNPLANRKNAAAVRIEVKRSSPEVVIQLESDGESEKKEFVTKDAPKKANMDSDSSATLTIQLPESEAKIVLPVRHDFSAATPIEEPWLVDLFSQTLDLFPNSTNPLIPHLIQTFFSPEALAHRQERHHLLASSHAITKLSDFDHTVITQYVSLFTTTDSTFDETVFHSAVIIALSAILALDPTRIYAAWKERDGLVDVESEHVIVDVAQGYLYAATRDDREASEEVEGLRYFERLWGGEGCALEEEMKSPPRIAFFALHTIKAGSELTVDYGDVDVPGFEYTGMCKCNVIGKEGGKVTCKRAPVRNGKRKWVEEIEDDVQVGKKKGKGLTKKK
ncbi:hypothetical protein HDU79_002835 [Rhizoclosmatium sp. JEL0117]|nr:hypothetical protein HDU79_002835 [Rhizoclosmatium sp. JEL0117]